MVYATLGRATRQESHAPPHTNAHTYNLSPSQSPGDPVLPSRYVWPPQRGTSRVRDDRLPLRLFDLRLKRTTRRVMRCDVGGDRLPAARHLRGEVLLVLVRDGVARAEARELVVHLDVLPPEGVAPAVHLRRPVIRVPVAELGRVVVAKDVAVRAVRKRLRHQPRVVGVEGADEPQVGHVRVRAERLDELLRPAGRHESDVVVELVVVVASGGARRVEERRPDPARRAAHARERRDDELELDARRDGRDVRARGVHVGVHPPEGVVGVVADMQLVPDARRAGVCASVGRRHGGEHRRQQHREKGQLTHARVLRPRARGHAEGDTRRTAAAAAIADAAPANPTVDDHRHAPATRGGHRGPARKRR
mmetsp:Transcript_53936/g.159853  ORF Transcript_53936/g.159853 Transcript_53936/m.159853 type:complete len:364 (+) Transcript_53936:22-1113(+)